MAEDLSIYLYLYLSISISISISIYIYIYIRLEEVTDGPSTSVVPCSWAQWPLQVKFCPLSSLKVA